MLPSAQSSLFSSCVFHYINYIINIIPYCTRYRQIIINLIYFLVVSRKSCGCSTAPQTSILRQSFPCVAKSVILPAGAQCYSFHHLEAPFIKHAPFIPSISAGILAPLWSSALHMVKPFQFAFTSILVQ